MSQKPKLFLIDSSSLIFRAFYAIRHLSTSKGVPTNATYGFLTMLLGVLEKHKPEYIACVFDTPKPSFRKEMFPEYKANRGAPPEELIPQFEQIRRVVDALGIRRLEAPGYEADDVIGTLATRFKNCEIVIVSGDKDLMQLVDEHTKILDTMKDVLYGPDEVVKKMGVGPTQITDFLGLVGDASDNIPGVAGIGPKTAVDLLKEFGSLEGVLESTGQMKPSKRREALENSGALARISKQLATVETKVPGEVLDLPLDSLKHPDGFLPAFIDILREFEFRGLIKKYEGNSSGASSELSGPASDSSRGKAEVVTILSKEQWRGCLADLEKHDVIAFDTETRGERTTEREIVGFSLCGDGERAYYVPLRHRNPTDPHKEKQLKPHGVFADLLGLFSRKNSCVVGQNFKYDYKMLLQEGFETARLSECFGSTWGEGRVFDTMLAHYLLEPEEKHGLDALSLKFLDTTIGDFKEVLGDHEEFSMVTIEDGSTYGALDAWATRRLYDVLKPRLLEEGFEKLFYEIEMPAARVIAHMEQAGISVDVSVLQKMSSEFELEITQIEKDIFKLAGGEFNLNSPKQLSEILFTKLGLPVIQKTKTGFSTDVNVLEKLAPMHPVPELILRYRELNKLKSTYVDVIPTLVEKDGRVHANFNQAVTATGRLSSSDPNLQNIPVKTENGRRIRRAFVAGPSRTLVGADYSQVELRLVAHLSGDEALCAAFAAGEDVHRATAAEIFQVVAAEVTDEQRAAAKAINFGLIYGKTAFGLSQELGITRAQAQSYIDAYFVRYKGVKAYMDRCIELARKNKATETAFGRRRPLKDIDSKNFAVRANAERMAINSPVQGTAADLMKLAMIRVAHAVEKFDAKLILQVHDELVLDVPESRAKEALQTLTHEMESVAKFSVPLKVNGAIAQTWFDL